MPSVKEDYPLQWAPGVTIRHMRRSGRSVTRVEAPAKQAGVALSPQEAAVADRIDGRTSTRQLLSGREFRGPQGQALVRQTLAKLEQAGLLGRSRGVDWLVPTAEDPASVALRKMLTWGQVETRLASTLKDTEIEALAIAAPQTDCPTCALDCCHFNVTVGRREVMPLCQATAQAGWRPAQLFAAPQGQPAADRGLVTLRRGDDGACVLLKDDGRCEIHALAGLHAKPSPCQLYPAVPVLMPRGGTTTTTAVAPNDETVAWEGRLGLRAGCPHANARDDGEARESYAETLRHLRHHRGTTLIRCAPERVVIASWAPPVPWALYASKEREAVERASQASSGVDAVQALAAVLAPRDANPETALRHEAAALAELLQTHRSGGDDVPLGVLASAPTPQQGPSGGDSAQWAQHVSRYPGALELLRWPSVAAGLGVLHLAALAAHHDTRRSPAVRLAHWFRVFDRDPIRRHLNLRGVDVLESLAPSACIA